MSEPPKVRFSDEEIVTFSDADVAPEAAPSAGPARRFASNWWQTVNPMQLAEVVKHPLDTVRNIGRAQGQEGMRAAEALKAGDYPTALRHGLGYLLPILGPQLSAAGEQMQQGDIAGGLGTTAGIATAAAGPKAVTGPLRGAAAVTRRVAPGLPAALDRGVTARYGDVMTPKVGPNKVRFGNQAKALAPTLAREEGLGAVTREGLAGKIETRLQEAELQLDAAANARNAKLVYHTKPILRELQARIDRLTAQTVRQGRVTAGQDVVPGPNSAQVAVLRRAMQEVEDLGPIASYESLRRIREAYDGPAKTIYSPAMTADYLVKKGEKVGASQVTGVLRDKLATFDPDTATANAKYHLYRSANDILQATEETNRARPTVGRRIMERATGAIVGGSAAGLEGAAIGAVVGPWVDAALTSGFTTQLQTARLMAQLADAIRGGQAARAQSLVAKIGRVVGRTERATVGTRAPVAALPVPGMAEGERE